MAMVRNVALASAFVVAFGSHAMAQDSPQYGPSEGDQEFLLSGSGGSTKSFDNNTFGATASYGYYYTDNIMLGARQTLGFGLVKNGTDSWNGSTVINADYVFDLGRWRPFVGVFVGTVYGKGVDFDGIAGGEAGLKWYANETTFVQLAASYGPTFTQGFNGGSFQYTLGMGLNF